MMNRKFMKKVMVLAFAGVLAMAPAAYAGTKAQAGTQTAGQAINGSDDSDISVVDGGWEVNSGKLSMKANKDAREAFNKAVDGLVGYDYEPIAVLGTQVVAGTNYSILCRGTVVYPDAEPEFVIATVYEDLDGKAEITGVKTIFKGSEKKDKDGGFTVNAGKVSLNQNKDAKAAYKKANASLVGAKYEPVAYLGSQVVNGTNYVALMRVTPVVPNAEPEFDLVTVHQDLKGNAKITSVKPVSIDA